MENERLKELNSNLVEDILKLRQDCADERTKTLKEVEVVLERNFMKHSRCTKTEMWDLLASLKSGKE